MSKCIDLLLEIANLWELCHFALPLHTDLRCILEKAIPLFGAPRYFVHKANSQTCSHCKKKNKTNYMKLFYFPKCACKIC